MESHYQIVIVGAGPAGMAAAVTAAKRNMRVAVFDEAATPGGQIYRGVEKAKFPKSVLGHDYHCGERLVQQFRSADIDYFPGSKIWNIESGNTVGVLYQGENRLVTADWLILAVGAMERPIPFDGWTLPGVMHAGAGQIMLKQAGLSPDGEMVLAGSGPLLLSLAAQYLRAGKTLSAIIDTTPKGRLWDALKHLPKALKAFPYLLTGLRLLLEIRRSKTPYFKNACHLKVEGNERVEAVSFTVKETPIRLKAKWLLTHFGVIPLHHLSAAADCEQQWDQSQYCWRPIIDEDFNSTVPKLKVIGDGKGILGAKSAELEGRLAGLSILRDEGLISHEEHAVEHDPVRRAWHKDIAIRPFLETYYRPDWSQLENVSEDTLICRCEEISLAEVNNASKHGVAGLNQLKSYTRCGMGACQGRQCGQAIATILAGNLGVSMQDVGYYRPRFPLKPITLGDLARLKT